MRISDWSSDVCSSDLPGLLTKAPGQRAAAHADVAGPVVDGATVGRIGDDRLADSFQSGIGGHPHPGLALRRGRTQPGNEQVVNSGLTPPLPPVRHPPVLL